MSSNYSRLCSWASHIFIIVSAGIATHLGYLGWTSGFWGMGKPWFHMVSNRFTILKMGEQLDEKVWGCFDQSLFFAPWSTATQLLFNQPSEESTVSHTQGVVAIRIRLTQAWTMGKSYPNVQPSLPVWGIISKTILYFNNYTVVQQHGLVEKVDDIS